MTVYYEWDVEEVDEHDSEQYEQGEIIEHYHFNSYAEALKFASQQRCLGGRWEIVLVRDDDDRRAWAYIGHDNLLPEYFSDANGCDYHKVPKRFHEEFNKYS